MKLMNLGVHFLVCLSLGGGFRGIRNRALIGCMLQRAVEGRGVGITMKTIKEKRDLRGSPSAISMAVIPRDH